MRRLHPVAAVAAVNAAGAFAAFMKDVLLAMFLGTSVQADAVALAVFVPEMIGILLLGTAIGTACVPIFAKIDVLDGRAALADRVWRTGGQVALLTIALYAACLLAAPSIVRWLAGGDGALEEATYPLLLIVLPIAVFYPIASVGMAVHQTLRSFLLPMAGPILTNVFMLASLSVLMAAGSSGQSGIAVVSWALTFGVAVLAAALWLPIRRMLRRAEPARDNPVESADSSIAPRLQLWAMAGQYGLLLAGTHVVYLAERFLAARMETGAVAALNYAFRLSQLPVWVYVGAFAAVMLPQLSRQLALKQSKELRDTMLKGLHNVMLITLPVTVLLWMLREPVVELLFMRGSFDRRSVLLTADVLEGYALTIAFLSIGAVALRYFLASQSLKAPTALAFLGSAVAIGADILLSARYGVRGLGYGAAAGAFVNMLGSVILLHRRIDLGGMIRPALRILAANLPPALLVWGLSAGLSWLGAAEGFMLLLVHLAGAALLYGVVYIRLLRSMKLVQFGLGERVKWRIRW